MTSREQKIAKQSIDSTFIITLGNIIYGIIIGITSLTVARLLEPADYGAYSLALAIPLFLQLLVGFGVRQAIIRYSAYYISQGDIATAQRMTKNGIIFLIVTSLGLTALSVALAGPISSVFLHRPGLTYFVEIASMSIIAQALFNFLTGAFVSWGIPIQDLIWNVIQALLKLALSVLFVLIGLGVLGALWGFNISFFAAGFFGIVFFYLVKLRKSSDPDNDVSHSRRWNLTSFARDVNRMIRFGLPAYLGNLILAFSQQPILVVILSFIASNTIIGYYSSATNITNALTLVSGSLTPVFFTVYAKLDGMKADTGAAFTYSVKYISYIVMPIVLFLTATSSLVIEIIYGPRFRPASQYLELLMFAYLPLAFGQVVLSSFFNGLGKTRYTLFMNLIETASTIIPALGLIIWLKLGVNGLLYSIIISNIMPTIYGLYVADRRFRARVDYFNLFKTLVVSTFSYMVLYLLSTFMFTVISGLIISLLVFVIELLVFLSLYLTLLPLVKAITREDVKHLKESTHGLKILSKFLHPILNYEIFVIDLISKKSSRVN